MEYHRLGLGRIEPFVRMNGGDHSRSNRPTGPEARDEGDDEEADPRPLVLVVDAEGETSLSGAIDAAFDREDVEVRTVEDPTHLDTPLGAGRAVCLVTGATGTRGEAELETLQRCKAVAPDRPVVLVAANGSEVMASRALEAGADGYYPRDLLEKRPERVATAIERLLEDAVDRPLGQDVRRFLERSSFLAVSLDPAGRVAWANQRLREALGEEGQGLNGYRFVERFVPDEAREEYRRFLDDLSGKHDGPTPPARFPCRRSRGDDLIVEWYGSHLPTNGIVLVGRDVTEHVAWERELERSEQRYRTLIENFPNGVVTLFDDDHRYTIVGGTGFERLSLSSEDLLGKRLEEVFPRENAEVLKPLYESALAGERGEVELTLEERRFRIFVVPVRDAEGEVFAGMTMSQDVTERTERERALQSSVAKYEALIEAAPDPIFVADAETGRVVETNRAAERLRGEDRSSIIGRHQSELHPAGERDRYRRLFERAVEHDGGTFGRFPEGTQVHATTADGEERIPVEINCRVVDLPDGTVIHGIFRDISERVYFEEALAALHETSHQVLYADSPEEVASTVVESAIDALEVEAVGVYGYDETSGELTPIATAIADGLTLGSPTFGPGEGLAWRAFAEGTSMRFDDVRSTSGIYNPETPIRSERIVPLNGHGILLAGHTESGIFDDRTIELLDVLAATTEAALDRAERERTLRHREAELRMQNRNLTRVEAVNAQIRRLCQCLVRADTRAEIAESICEELVETDHVALAFIVEPEAGDGRFDTKALAGLEAGRTEPPAELVRARGDNPIVSASARGEVTVVENVTANLDGDPWRMAAAALGYRSAICIPIGYREARFGVLALFAEQRTAFAGTERRILDEFGDIIGYAIQSIDRKHALMTERKVELEFEITDPSCVLLELAREATCDLTLEDTIPRPDDRVNALVTVDPDSVEDLIEGAGRFDQVQEARSVGEVDDRPVVQLTITGPFLAGRMADHGLELRRVTADESVARVVVATPPTANVRSVVDLMANLYPSSAFIARRQRGGEAVIGATIRERYYSRLTERQREAAELAYFGGYFDSPRGASGAEVADVMGISSSAFHRHLRAAERKIFELLFEGTGD